MAKTSLKKIKSMMKGVDICMLTTVDARGRSFGRPMSNNGEVDKDAKSYFFTWAKSPMVKEIKKNKNVSLAYVKNSIIKKLYISVTGKAQVTVDRAEMEKHWSKDLELWFDKGLDTPGIAMIEVAADHIKFWNGREEGEVDLK